MTPWGSGLGTELWITLGFACAGLVFGSFLNVCSYRLPRDESLLWPASHCPSCQQPLAWFENVPVMSWVALSGRCRTCRSPISVTYPAVEVTTGVLFAGGYLLYGFQPLLVVRLAFACAMIVLFVIDLQHQLLPFVITKWGTVAGCLASVMLPPGPVASLFGMALGWGMLRGMSQAYYLWRGRQGLGGGDPWMLAMIGAFLGWRLVLVTLFLASLSGSIVGVAVIASGRGGMTSKLPFGTFLAVGALAAALAGDRFLAWYVSFYR
jgi:leader peptidase (prepilin peptidase)/N-methyltransferase